MDFQENRERLNELVYASDVTCVEQLRLDRQSFKKLCIMLSNIGGLQDTKNMMVDEKVEMSLHILAHHVKNRVVKFRFERSGIIKLMPSYPYNKQVKIVVATMTLHNFIRRNSTQDTDFETSDTHDPEDADGIQDVQSKVRRIS
ncbi:hypothetical protein CFOL_v3_30663 [Cephalotus follicularis]|uniref:DUF8040 domain-containing protein n=1 Tax=Cephalotus follicularis TaxID=3775 RepID=A0A1Q3D400_CEPFO|nr:hypothetical protein CFOL_v3_30663 [Cephalotus follicularis]